MSEERFLELATKYLSNEASNEERASFYNYLEKEEYYNLFNNLKSEWEKTDSSSYELNFNVENGLQKLSQKIRTVEPEFSFKHEDEKQAKVFFFNPRLLKYAASIIFFILITTGTLYFSGLLDKKSESIAWNEKTTKMGEKYVLTLFDGTKITLNADSKLKYPVPFSRKSREVYLEGEAFFDVQHDANKPFIVHSGDISTIDIGTQFNINAFPEERNIEVSLVEGSVKISTNNSGSQKGDIVLEPMQQLIYNKENETNKVKSFEEQSAVGWKDNILVFDNEPLEKVLIKLQRTFGVQFELTDKSFNSKKIKGNFKNASLWTITEVIKKATGLKYKSIKENNETKKIVFYK